MIGYYFSWLLTITGVAYGWLNPCYGLMVYYALSTLRPPFLWFWSFDHANPPQLIQWTAISTLLGWGFIGLGNWSNFRWVRWPMLGLITYLLAGINAAQFHAVNAAVAWDALDTQLKIGLMALVTITLIRSARDIKIFAWVTIASLGYLAETFNEWYRQDPLYLWRNGWGGVDNNGVAMIMVMGVPLAFFFIINAKRLWVKALLFLATAAMAHVVLFSFSRGAQLGLCVVGAVLFIIALVALPRKLLTITLAIIFVAITIRLAGPEVRQRFFTIFADPAERDASAASRFDTWSGGLHCMLDHPLGVGPRNFNLVSDHYNLPPNKSIHNLFLQTGADYGIIGMLGLATFYVGTALQTFFASYNKTARRLVWPRYYCHMVTVSLSGFLVCSTFIGMESVEPGFIISLVGLCTVAYVRRIAATEAQIDKAPIPEFAQLNVTGRSLLAT